jgi:hypothetical protein
MNSDLEDIANEIKKTFFSIQKKDLECKGLVFKGVSNLFYNDKLQKLELRESLTLLKKQSCKCEKCYFLFEDFSNSNLENIIFPQIEDKALYTVAMINKSRDFETGYLDDWDWEFRKIEGAK